MLTLNKLHIWQALVFLPLNVEVDLGFGELWFIFFMIYSQAFSLRVRKGA